MPAEKAPGPSLLNFDMIKSAVGCPQIVDDIVLFLKSLKVKPGNGKKPDGIRPIAIGEAITHLFASIVLNCVA
ncbi:hypothetical protein P9112_006339 [Eukaryota sp. TZLM1-RC]